MSQTVRGTLSVSVTWTCPTCGKTRKVSHDAIRVEDEDTGTEHVAAEFEISVVVHCGPCDRQYNVEFE